MAIEDRVPKEYRKGVVIFADGKCKGNGDENAEIGGSFMLFKDGKITPIYFNDLLQRHVHLGYAEHPVRTSPVAECLTLIDVLNYVQSFVERCKGMGVAAPPITVLMDNEMAVHFANQEWNAKEPHMIPLRSQIVTHPALGSVTVKWISGKIMKLILGH